MCKKIQTGFYIDEIINEKINEMVMKKKRSRNFIVNEILRKELMKE